MSSTLTSAPVRTDKAPAAVGPYSQAIVAGDFVFCSGQLPIDLNANEMPESVGEHPSMFEKPRRDTFGVGIGHRRNRQNDRVCQRLGQVRRNEFCLCGIFRHNSARALDGRSSSVAARCDG